MRSTSIRRRIRNDINALSNFVADARNVIGFDPFERLVDYLIQRAGVHVAEGEPAGAAS